tara:strand:- start:179 stop:460 length:282 start_codon:yes stop_codon:yes gene_type:complete
MSELERQKKLIKKIIKQLSGDIDESTELVPEYGILGSGYMFCFQPATKSFIKIYKNQVIYVLGKLKNNRLLIYTTCAKIVEIDADEIFKMDFN